MRRCSSGTGVDPDRPPAWTRSVAGESKTRVEPSEARIACRACGKPIRERARRCPHCRSAQGRPPLWRRPLAWVAAATTILSLFFSLDRLYDAWSSARSLERGLASHIANARTLADAGDFGSAWRSLEAARALDPTASEIGVAQIEIAAPWLLAAGSPVGWVPSGSASQERPTESPGAIADIVYLALVTAAFSAEGTDRADLEGLAAWARYLRGRELRGRRQDIAADLLFALEHDANGYYPNLFLGFWRAAMDEDPAAARPAWDRALAVERTRDLPPMVRSMQLYTLGRRVERARSYRHDEAARDRAARAMYLQAVNEMRLAGESPEGRVYAKTYAALYFEPLSRNDQFEEMFEVLPLEEQLATVGWLQAAIQPERKSYDATLERFLLIRGRLLEALGRGDEARRVVAEARAGEVGGNIREVMDQTWVRMTGEAVVPADEWAARAYYLERSPFSSPEVREALDALGEGWPRWRVSSSDTLMTALDAGIDRVSAELAAQPDAASIGGLPREELESRLRQLHHFRGAKRSDEADFAGGTRELEALLRDPELSPPLRPRTLIDLALAYVYSPRALHIDRVRSDPEYEVLLIYLSEGLDRLSAALDAGFSDWDLIEKSLKSLRLHPSYTALSLRHNRVPPRDDES
jgi:hypothetical protein